MAGFEPPTSRQSLAGFQRFLTHIRSDNGPEFIAGAIGSWLKGAKIDALYIEPGSPWENGYAESFHSKLRDELLAVEVFDTLSEAKTLGMTWRLEYNHRRPHSSLGYKTPASFAASLAPAPVAALPIAGASEETGDTLIAPGTKNGGRPQFGVPVVDRLTRSRD